jgi:plastocyanin
MMSCNVPGQYNARSRGHAVAALGKAPRVVKVSLTRPRVLAKIPGNPHTCSGNSLAPLARGIADLHARLGVAWNHTNLFEDTMTKYRWLAAALLGASLLSAGCRGDKDDIADDDAARAAPSSARSAAGSESHDDDHDVPAPTGKVIIIQLLSDEKGNRFEPARVEAHQGDVLRFALASGVHNIDFLPDSNPGKTGLPPASEMLQLPGQTLDVPVNFAPGHYRFQCDPHAPLGMVGWLEVEKHD